MPQTDDRSACPANLLRDATRVAAEDDAAGLSAVDRLLAEYQGDAKLHFLRGSLLAALRRYGEAAIAMRTAVDLAPDYAIARFQLGLLQLTSGDALTAKSTWSPLAARSPNDPLLLFASGLNALAQDRFQESLDQLSLGLAHNTAYPPLNADMRMLIEAIKNRPRGPAPLDESTPLTHLLLQHYGTKH